MITIPHKFVKSRRFGMLIPYGEKTNKSITDLKKGEHIQSMDGEQGTVVDVAVISTRSDILNVLSLMIYGLPFQDIFAKMQANYGKLNIQDDDIIFLIVE